VFVYTREAHPGEKLPCHASFEDKLDAARRLRDDIGLRRAILVDDLDGGAHRRYGLLPNMTWVIGRGGRIAYKADWTSAANVEAFLVRFLGARTARRPGAVLSPYVSEQLEFREVDREAFYRHLEERNGPRALEEFREAERIWSERG
jgi:hypothetical protein